MRVHHIEGLPQFRSVEVFRKKTPQAAEKQLSQSRELFTITRLNKANLTAFIGLRSHAFAEALIKSGFLFKKLRGSNY